MEEVKRTEGRKFIPPFFNEYFSASDIALYDAILMWERIPRRKKKWIKKMNGSKYKEFLASRTAERIRIALEKYGQKFLREAERITDYLNR